MTRWGGGKIALEGALGGSWLYGGPKTTAGATNAAGTETVEVLVVPLSTTGAVTTAVEGAGVRTDVTMGAVGTTMVGAVEMSVGEAAGAAMETAAEGAAATTDAGVSAAAVVEAMTTEGAEPAFGTDG